MIEVVRPFKTVMHSPQLCRAAGKSRSAGRMNARIGGHLFLPDAQHNLDLRGARNLAEVRRSRGGHHAH